MRIISGKHKGRKLKEFNGMDIRPTSDRAKEALFNIFYFDIEGSEFLDLFCGTGSIGIEAISRGAKEVTFVDNNKESIAICKFNLNMIKEQGLVYQSEAESFLLKTSKTYDIIFLDPPYSYDGVDNIIDLIFENKLLSDGGYIIYEHKEDRKFDTDKFEIFDRRKYGIAIFELMRNK